MFSRRAARVAILPFSPRRSHAAVPAAGDFDREWRRRESNPRRRSASDESQEDLDLASADAGESASKERHKRHPAAADDERPSIHPGQLDVFDLLDDG